MPAAAHAAAAQVGDRSRLASFVQHAPVAPSPRCAVTRKLRQRHVRNEWGPRGSGGPSRPRSGAGDAPGPSERGPCPRPGPKSRVDVWRGCSSRPGGRRLPGLRGRVECR